MDSQKQASLATSVLSFQHLSYHLTLKDASTKFLVDDVSVEVKAGELLAIMVSSLSIHNCSLSHHFSGTVRCRSVAQRIPLYPLLINGDYPSGKSTLLDLMAFRKHATGGSSVSALPYHNTRFDLDLKNHRYGLMTVRLTPGPCRRYPRLLNRKMHSSVF